jgi:Rrf2 family transcriptional regulator, nitric oxide-sensitive transcriptional repressor
MISQTAQYALRAVVCLASRPNTAMTTVALAELTKVPEKYLSKVMQTLVRADIVSSKPGKTGGFVLKMPPDTLTMLHVVEAIDIPSNQEAFPLGMQTYGNIMRPLHQKLAFLQTMVKDACANVKIKDLVS